MSTCFIAFALLVAAVNAAPQQQSQHQPQPQHPPPQPPQINWGKCEQLKPTDSDKEQKRQVIEKCLSSHPVPNTDRITREQIEEHRDLITSCALKEEGWFDTNGYKFDRAKTEIKSKKLQSDIEGVILNKHDECEKEAKQRFQDPTEQVKLYQACMDYHISETCNIHVIPPPGQGPPQQFHQGPPPQQGPQRG